MRIMKAILETCTTMHFSRMRMASHSSTAGRSYSHARRCIDESADPHGREHCCDGCVFLPHRYRVLFLCEDTAKQPRCRYRKSAGIKSDPIGTACLLYAGSAVQLRNAAREGE